MRKITLTCLSLIVASGVAFAGTPCNGFKIKIKNNTPDKFLVTNINLTGGDFNPGGLETISPHSEQVFIVNNTVNNAKMQGEIRLHTISLPSKNVVIQFGLRNHHVVCHHNTIQLSGDYKLRHRRLPNHVNYSIG